MAKSSKTKKAERGEQVEDRPAMSLAVGAGFRARRQLTFNLRKITDGETIYCQIVSPIEVSATKSDGRLNAEGKKMDPAHVCEIVEYSPEGEVLHEGEVKRIIVNKILLDTITEAFPQPGAEGKPGYVGQFFRITRQGKRTGKRYNEFSVIVLESAS